MIYIIMAFFFGISSILGGIVFFRELLHNGFNDDYFDSIFLGGSFCVSAISAMLSYGFYKMYSENLSFLEVFG